MRSMRGASEREGERENVEWYAALNPPPPPGEHGDKVPPCPLLSRVTQVAPRSGVVGSHVDHCTFLRYTPRQKPRPRALPRRSRSTATMQHNNDGNRKRRCSQQQSRLLEICFKFKTSTQTHTHTAFKLNTVPKR